jgi:hypothetical protein
MVSYWTLDYLKCFFSGHSNLIVSALDDFFPDRKKHPLPNETVALAPRTRMKTSALLYDRIWALPVADVPEDIRCFGDTQYEREFLFSLLLFKEMPSLSLLIFDMKNLEDPRRDPDDFFSKWGSNNFMRIPRNLTVEGLSNASKVSVFSMWDFYASHVMHDLMNKMHLWQLGKDDIALNSPMLNEAAFLFLSHFARGASEAFSRELGVPIIPVYASRMLHNWQYQPGDRKIISLVLDNLEIVDEENLTWEQVSEFRNDKDAKNKYRRLIHWLDEEMIGKSSAFVEDALAIKLEDYERALKKHGITTILGTVEEALDGKYLVGASAVISSSMLSGHPILGLFLGTGLIVGKVALKLSQMSLDVTDVEFGENSEVSWLWEVKKKLGPNDKG